MSRYGRRDFILHSGSALVAGNAALSALRTITPASAAEAAVTPSLVRLNPEMEQTVQWIERTPRDEIFAAAVERLMNGLPYRDLLGGLFLAGIRNIQPRPVGFKFHAVMVINSAHQLSLDSPQEDRLSPLFWALDNFKKSQDQDVREGDWWLGPPNEPALPPAEKARELFEDAMERWDEEAADAAVTALCRTAGAGEVKELFWQYGARNQRNIGHNIIFTAQSFRTLETIGWRHAEPVLRSLVYGILAGERGEATAAPFEANRELAKSVRPGWTAGTPDGAATTDLLDVIRHGTPGQASAEVAAMLNRGVAPASLWDGVILAANELVLRRPGIGALHAITASNSHHYAFRVAAQDTTRLLLLLQAAAWIPMFRGRVLGSGSSAAQGPRIDAIQPVSGDERPALDEVFDEIAEDRMGSARKVFTFARQGGSPRAFMDTARHLVFEKGNDAHDYKFSAAAFEEIIHAGEAWRPHLMAASAMLFKGTAHRDSPLLDQTRQALERLTS